MTTTFAFARRVALAALPLASVLALGLSACKDSFIPDYNNPALSSVITDRAQLQSQVSGLLAGDREMHAFQILIMETMGRDAYRIDVADSRYIQQPLGTFSPGAFIVDFLWNVRYRAIRGAQVLVTGINATTVLSTAERAAARGFARTLLANQYIALMETRDTLGVPIAIGSGAQDPVRCKPAVLTYVSALLDSAAVDLAAGGTSFPFALPGGFSGFDAPPTFLTFNRALATKVLTYRALTGYPASAPNNTLLDSALTLWGLTFAGTGVPLRTGVFHLYSAASGDLSNGNYDNSVYRANPKVTADTEPGDLRNAKIRRDPTALRQLGDGSVASDILFTNINSPTSPLPVVTNEELLLLRAELLWARGRDVEALALMNTVRNQAGGLGPKVMPVPRINLLRAILREKRMSLIWESDQRFVDFRMFGLIGDLGTEKVNPGKEPTVVPFPQAEIDARNGLLACS